MRIEILALTEKKRFFICQRGARGEKPLPKKKENKRDAIASFERLSWEYDESLPCTFGF